MTTQRSRSGNHGRRGRASRTELAPQFLAGAELPAAGAIGQELAREVEQVWLTAAVQAGRDVGDFDASAPLAERLAWAAAHELPVATVLARYSSRDQHSTADQVRECAAFAAAQGFYLPPEFVSIDEGTTGRRLRRDGVERMRAILGPKLAQVLLVFKVSRLFRKTYKGYELFQEEIVERNLRGISISQGIDTADGKTWEMLTVLHGLSDSMLLTATADHVRAGLFGLARQGYTIGGLTVGYRRRDVPGARPTNMGKPRTVPEIDPEAAVHIRRAFERIRDGMSLRDARRRYNDEGGPVDPRSSSSRLTETAFRRMLSNRRYTGHWEFGRFRSVWSNSLDYNTQVRRPDGEVIVIQNEELRIVEDELFFAVQAKLERLKRTAPTGPKRRKEPKLWDCVVDCFYCSACDARCYLNGGDCKGMRCKNGPDCPKRFSLRRETAVRAVCDALSTLVIQDAELIAEVIAAAGRLDAAGSEDAQRELDKIRRRIATLSARIDELEDLAGEGDAEARDSRRTKIRAAEQERAGLRAEESRFRMSLGIDRTKVTPERVTQRLTNLTSLLTEGTADRLPADDVYLAAEAFRRLVGGRIDIRVAESPGRKRHPIRGAFTPDLLRVAQAELGLPTLAGTAGSMPVEETEVWLREPWPLDRLADRVGTLIEEDGLSHAEVVNRLAAEGHAVSKVSVGRIYRRYRDLRAMIAATTENAAARTEPSHRHEDASASAA